MAIFGRTVRRVRDVEISLHHPMRRGRAFDDTNHRQETAVVNIADMRSLYISIRQ